MNAQRALSIGVDLGTGGARALIVRCETGEILAQGRADYASGVGGILTDPAKPLLARQRPRDHRNAVSAAVCEAVSALRRTNSDLVQNIVGIGVDATGSTPLPVDDQIVPLADDPAFADDLAAQAWLWKDHTAADAAHAITQACHTAAAPFLDTCGGAYSSEWFWAKALACAQTSSDVSGKAATWIELSDYIPAWLCGCRDVRTVARNICAAGHKGLYAETWGGFPNRSFLAALHPVLGRLRDTMNAAVAPGARVGELCGALAQQWGLEPGVAVGAGMLDAHAGAVAAGARPGTLVKIVGTSTCDIAVRAVPAEASVISGISGQVVGSVLPGLEGLEAGQAAVGDLFAWWVRLLGPGLDHDRLAAAAEHLAPGESGLVALDWNNGNRSILLDPGLSGILLGQTLATSAADVYRALVEATAFGASIIVRHLEAHGVVIDRIVLCGGVAEKSALVRRVYADVLARPIDLAGAAESCALGAAMLGAVAGGVFDDLSGAQQVMAPVPKLTTEPHPSSGPAYARLERLYRRLHDAFGANSGEAIGDVMGDLAALRDQVRKTKTRGE